MKDLPRGRKMKKIKILDYVSEREGVHSAVNIKYLQYGECVYCKEGLTLCVGLA